MEIQDLTSIITVSFIIIGTSIGLYQWTHANRIKRSEFLNQIIDKLRFDEAISKVMYTIEYTEGWYDRAFHNGPNEKLFDQFFAYLNYICYLRNNGIVSENEFKLLRYELTRVCQNIDTQNYFWNLYHFSKRIGSDCSFHELIRYGLKKNIFLSGFRNPDCRNYTKYLNF